MIIRLTTIPRILAFGVGWWLITSGMQQLGAQSKGADSWRAETSFMALQLRAQGTTNIGLGWLAMGSSVIGLKIGEDQTDDKEGSNNDIQKLIEFAKSTEPKVNEQKTPTQKSSVLPPNLPIQ